MKNKLAKLPFLLILIILLSLGLRLWGVDRVPVSLFGDELDVGYHAFSVLNTGRDYTGHIMPLHFRSLAEWRTPLYLYSAVPTVALFGVSPLGVRLPAIVFGVLGVWLIYLLANLIFKNRIIALLAAFFLAISPWHLHYSRAGFEVTEMLTFYLAGVYFFIRGLKEHKLLILSALFLGLTPFIYNTAKLFLPLTMIALVVIWKDELRRVKKKYLALSLIIFTLIVVPFAWNTVFGGGTQRFEYVSLFGSKTAEGELGAARLVDTGMQNSLTMAGVNSPFVDKLLHNRFASYGGIFINNYLHAFSTDFLFTKGGFNPRQSVPGMGQFYIFEFVFLVVGVCLFAKGLIDKKIKLFILFWILSAPIPSSLTLDGADHQTRLFTMLPVLILFISQGVYGGYVFIKERYRYLYIFALGAVVFWSLVTYEHSYWVHYPWDTERWWHAGMQEAVSSAVEEGRNFNKVIISNANEPMLIFFLGWSQYSPFEFQKSYPLKTENIPGFGQTFKLGKYYFGEQGSGIDLYQLGSKLPQDSLYLATEKEIKLNLIREPGRVPKDVRLIKSIAYPSGLPSFYLFARTTNE